MALHGCSLPNLVEWNVTQNKAEPQSYALKRSHKMHHNILNTFMSDHDYTPKGAKHYCVFCLLFDYNYFFLPIRYGE